jgi:hypothetical protein
VLEKSLDESVFMNDEDPDIKGVWPDRVPGVLKVVLK